MSYELAIGDRTYSSWSLRGWLMFEAFGLPFIETRARMYTPEFTAMLAEFAPARLVPAARIDGHVVWDSLAIGETLAERHPDKGFWPKDAPARMKARSMCAEMHSGFTALRNACTMNLRHAYATFEPSAEVLADIARIEMFWESCPGEGWLFGDYSIADAFFAPAATRIATYGLPVGPRAAAYVAKTLAMPEFRRWRAMGLAQNFIQPGYDKDLPAIAWPGPTPLAAKSVAGVPAMNATCPYSGAPVAADSLLEIDGQVIGYCNTFCRDKTLHDPEAWPATMALLGHR